MKFVSTRLEEEWNDRRLPVLLRVIVLEGAERSVSNHGWEWHITSIYRSPQEDNRLDASGVHTQWRAVDVRTRNLEVLAESIATWINTRWIYDPGRPHLNVCVFKPHGTGPHLHIQVYHKTVLA